MGSGRRPPGGCGLWTSPAGRPPGAERAGTDRGLRPARPPLLANGPSPGRSAGRADRRACRSASRRPSSTICAPRWAAALQPLALELAARLERPGFVGRTLSLKVRYKDFRIASRRVTRAAAFRGDDILQGALQLLAQRPRPDEAVRLLGIGVSSETVDGDSRQLALPLMERRSAGR